MKLGDQVNGVIVLSSLGYGKFDEEDQRLARGARAPMPPSPSRTPRCSRRSDEAARDLGRAAASSRSASRRLRSVGDILQEAIETIPSLAPCAAVGAYVRDEPTRATSALARLLQVVEPAPSRARAEIADVPAEVGDARSCSRHASRSSIDARRRSSRSRASSCRHVEPREVLVAPLRWDPDGFGAIALDGARGRRGSTRPRTLRLAARHRGHHVARARQRAPALRARAVPRARREPRRGLLGGRRHDPRRSRSSAARADDLLGPTAPPMAAESGRAWGSHIDRRRSRATPWRRLPGRDRGGEDQALEYRVATPEGEHRVDPRPGARRRGARRALVSCVG